LKGVPRNPGGGFKEIFFRGETRNFRLLQAPFKVKKGILCRKGATESIDFQVGVDALSVVVQTSNNWAPCLTVED
jgi:hypothetical protein